MRIGQQPVGNSGGLDIEAVMAGVAIGICLVEQAGEAFPERLKLGREGVFPL